MVKLSKDPDTMDSLALQDLISRLDLSKDMADTQMPTYENVYQQTLVGDKNMMEKHREVFNKILKWPRDDNNKVRSMG
jgi:hypothetical protein